MEVRQYQRIIFIIALIGFRSDKSLKYHKIEEKDDKQKWKLLCCILLNLMILSEREQVVELIDLFINMFA